MVGIKRFQYIGYPVPFKSGDILTLKPGHTFLIDGLLEKGIIKYGDTYTFEKYDGYVFGNNYCKVAELEFSLPECSLTFLL